MSTNTRNLRNLYNETDNRLTGFELRLRDLQFQLQRESLRQRGIVSKIFFHRLELTKLMASISLPEFLPEKTMNMEGYYDWLKNKAPHAYEKWIGLLSVNEESYEGFPVDSCSVHGHVISALFGDFLFPYLYGNVLDVGCGPQPLPSYLDGYPVDRIFGIDPLADTANKQFTFHQGIAENLPWADNSFQCVVAATSLDHVLLLDKTFDEIQRVLLPSGWFVLWVHFTPGAAPYNPYVEDIVPIDKYHLFHFDQAWFEQAMGVNFSYAESIHLENYGNYRGSFYAYQVRK